jgi:hypothetical protein
MNNAGSVNLTLSVVEMQILREALDALAYWQIAEAGRALPVRSGFVLADLDQEIAEDATNEEREALEQLREVHALDEFLRLAIEGVRCSCIEGWVPGEQGVERCDDCQRFGDDNEAAEHVREGLRTLIAHYADDRHEEPEAWIRRALREQDEPE